MMNMSELIEAIHYGVTPDEVVDWLVEGRFQQETNRPRGGKRPGKTIRMGFNVKQSAEELKAAADRLAQRALKSGRPGAGMGSLASRVHQRPGSDYPGFLATAGFFKKPKPEQDKIINRAFKDKELLDIRKRRLVGKRPIASWAGQRKLAKAVKKGLEQRTQKQLKAGKERKALPPGRK